MPCYPLNLGLDPSLGGGCLSLASATFDSPLREGRRIGRHDGQRLFRAAARHSRLVKFLRRAIPAAIGCVGVFLVVAMFFNPFRLVAAFPIDPGKLSLSGTKIVMELPRVTGFTRELAAL